MAVFPLWVEHGYCVRKYLVREVMVADDDVDSEGIGQVYLIYGLDSAVDGDDEGHSGLSGILYALRGYSVSLVVPVRNIEVYIL